MKHVLKLTFFCFLLSCADNPLAEPDFKFSDSKSKDSKSKLTILVPYNTILDQLSNSSTAIALDDQREIETDLKFNSDKSEIQATFTAVPSNQNLAIYIKFFNDRNVLVGLATAEPIIVGAGEEKTIRINYLKIL